MPGGRHIYLKASSTVERQQWVVALGTSKQDEEGTMEKCESLSWELVHMEIGIELCYSTVLVCCVLCGCVVTSHLYNRVLILKAFMESYP